MDSYRSGGKQTDVGIKGVSLLSYEQIIEMMEIRERELVRRALEFNCGCEQWTVLFIVSLL